MLRRSPALFTVLLIILSFSALEAQVARLDGFTPPADGDPGRVRVVFTIPEGHYQGYDEEFFGLKFPDTAPYRIGDIVYPEPDEIDGDERKYRGETAVEATVLPSSGTGEAEIIAFYQICQDDGLCLFPEEETLALASASATQRGGGGPALPRLLLFLLLAFAGGLLLNVMPCVLPVLSIKALGLVAQREADARSRRLHALLFAAGVAATLLALGAAVILLKSAGAAVGWGFQFQNPYYLFALVLLLLLFSLSLFDVWTFSVTLSGSAAGGTPGAFASGVVTVLLATPCSAPFLGTALGFAFAARWWVILLIFSAVAAGLALPFTLIGFVPALGRRLPKPGPWMERFKQAMAFPLLGTAAWLFGILTTQIGAERVTTLLFMLLGVGLAAWIWGIVTRRARTRLVRRAAALVMLALLATTVAILPVSGNGEKSSAESEGIPDGWREFSAEAVASARADGRPVFIQFTADWCLTCKTNEATVFSRKEVDAAFEELGVVRFYGDYTLRNDEIGRWIEDFGRAGVPVYALYPPGRASPVLLPELLTPALLIRTLTNHLAW